MIKNVTFNGEKQMDGFAIIVVFISTKYRCHILISKENKQ